MSHWIFTEEHEMFRKTVKKFIANEITPHIRQWEREQATPRELFKRMGQLGYLGIKVPAAYGGLGLDVITEAVLIEELGKCGAAGVGASVGAHIGIAMTPVMNFGNEHQKHLYLTPSVKGEKIAALGITEPNAGSDVANLSTTAVRDGDNYRLNGSKTFITNGSQADYAVIAAKTGNGPPHRDISLFIVDTDTLGFHKGNRLDKLGWHSSDTAELFLEDVRVPAENRIGAENEGFYYIMKNFQWERIILSLSSVAQAEEALESAKKYSQERTQFGRPISNFQVLRHKMVDMAIDIEKAKNITYRALYLYSQGKDVTTEATVAKAYAGEMVNRVSDQAVQIHGGAGYMMEYDVQRYWRDARIQSIGGGTTQIMKEILVKRFGIVDTKVDPSKRKIKGGTL